jgi:hypothetical protein
MAEKPTYKELEQRGKELEKKVLKCNPAEEALRDSSAVVFLFIVRINF